MKLKTQPSRNQQLRHKHHSHKELGAVAVEFALVAPLLLALIAGIVEFAYQYNAQISTTQAAREAAREYSISKDWGKATTAGINGAPGAGLTAGDFTLTSGACSASNKTVKVTVQHVANSPTGFSLNIQGGNISFASTFTATGVGAMRCGG
ncbi:TadE family protein [Pseudarthrobacter sp. J1738]|uniref:TadE family protein n=1 Tax=Pseudarthrobacter sp. J1738 TaxID=3420446 RepID=UPI003D283B3B